MTRVARRVSPTGRVTIESLAGIRPDHEELYSRYRQSTDFDGPFSIQHCLWDKEDVSRNLFRTLCISVFDGDKLIAGGYFD